MRVVAGIVAILLVAGCASTPSPTNEIIVKDCSGGTFSIPTDGMRRSEEGIAAARELEQLGELITEWRSKQALRPEVARQTDVMLCQLLDAAAADLQQAYRIASTTSGPLDSKLVASASSIGRSARSVVGIGDAPETNRVTTRVTSSVTGPYVVFYLPFRKYRMKVWDWSSHTPGEKLDIGAYYFRVRTAGKEFDELVNVFHDPTNRVLHVP